MAKRNNSSPFKFYKKPKLDIPIPSTSNNSPRDDFWGEELNEDEVEECILQASQACSELISKYPQQLDKTLSGYSEFKFPTSSTKLVTSTQTHLCKPSTSKDVSTFSFKSLDSGPPKNGEFVPTHGCNTLTEKNDTLIYRDDQKGENLFKELERLKAENAKLWSKYETKDGEVGILRNQIKQIQKNVDTVRLEKFELAEKEKQIWTEKVVTLNRELNSVKSELELKDLEVVNFRQRCQMLLDNKDDFPAKLLSSFKQTQRKQPMSTVFCQTGTNIQKIFQEPLTYYPLKSQVIPLFNQNEDSDYNKNDENVQITYSDVISTDPKEEETRKQAIENPPEMFLQTSKMENEEPLEISYILGDLSKLLTLSQVELDSDKSRFVINKIIYVCEEILLNTCSALRDLKKVPSWKVFQFSNVGFHVATVPNRQAIFESRPITKNENAIIARQIVATVAAITAHSSYLAAYVSGKGSLRVHDDSYIKSHSQYFIARRNYIQEWNNQPLMLLNLLLNITTMIIDYKRMNYCSGLLWAVIHLLNSSIFKTTFDTDGKKCIYEIIKQVVFSRPPFAVLCAITKFLRCYSWDGEFMNLALCQQPNKRHFMRNNRLLKYTKDACLLQIFTTQLSSYVHHNNTKLEISIKQVEHLSVLFYNYLSEFRKMYSKESTMCECSINLVKTYVKMVNVSLRHFVTFHYLYKVPKQILWLKTTYPSVISLLVLIMYHKEFEIRLHSEYHQQNLTILQDIAEQLDLNEVHGQNIKTMIKSMNNQVLAELMEDEELFVNEEDESKSKSRDSENMLEACFERMMSFD